MQMYSGVYGGIGMSSRCSLVTCAWTTIGVVHILFPVNKYETGEDGVVVCWCRCAWVLHFSVTSKMTFIS